MDQIIQIAKSLGGKIFICFLCLGVLAILWTLVDLLINGKIYLIGHIDLSEAGQFGDYVGGFIGTLFSIATMALIWLTYTEQHKEIELQHKESEFRKFDSTFFNLLGILNSIIENMESGLGANAKKGRVFLKQTSYECQEFLNIEKNRGDRVKQVYQDYENNLGPYLKMIRLILRTLNEIPNSMFYISTFNANLSGHEVVLLNYLMFTNLLSEPEKDILCKFKTLIDIDKNMISLDGYIYECKDHSS